MLCVLRPSDRRAHHALFAHIFRPPSDAAGNSGATSPPHAAAGAAQATGAAVRGTAAAPARPFTAQPSWQPASALLGSTASAPSAGGAPGAAAAAAGGAGSAAPAPEPPAPPAPAGSSRGGPPSLPPGQLRPGLQPLSRGVVRRHARLLRLLRQLLGEPGSAPAPCHSRPGRWHRLSVTVLPLSRAKHAQRTRLRICACPLPPPVQCAPRAARWGVCWRLIARCRPRWPRAPPHGRPGPGAPRRRALDLRSPPPQSPPHSRPQLRLRLRLGPQRRTLPSRRLPRPAWRRMVERPRAATPALRPRPPPPRGLPRQWSYRRRLRALPPWSGSWPS
jgi:hypothetical protein